MISSVILPAQVPSVSPLRTLIVNYLIKWFKITIIMHQAMLLTAQVHFFSLVSAHKLTCYSRVCIGAWNCQLIWLALLVTRNRVYRLVPHAGILLYPVGMVIPWSPGNYWGCSVEYFTTADRIGLPQGSSSGKDELQALWFALLLGFRCSGNCKNIIPHRIWVYSCRKIWWSGARNISCRAFQIWLTAMT